jgi:hypothetical protein
MNINQPVPAIATRIATPRPVLKAEHALLAAAEGTVSAYKEITGEDWKAYQAPAQGPATVDRRSADAQLSALAG